jgi:hypothetical protein
MRGVLLIVVLLMGAGAALAQQPIHAPDLGRAALASRAALRYPQPVRVGDLIGRDVLEPTEAQPILGHVDAVVRRADGGIDMIVRFGGLFGFGSRPIAVPIEAMALLGEYVSILDFTPAQLKTFPTDDGAGETALPANDTIRVGLVGPFH